MNTPNSPIPEVVELSSRYIDQFLMGAQDGPKTGRNATKVIDIAGKDLQEAIRTSSPYERSGYTWRHEPLESGPILVDVLGVGHQNLIKVHYSEFI